MMLKLLRSRWLKAIFLLCAVAGAVVAVSANRKAVQSALGEMTPASLLASILLSVMYVWATMLSWRAVMRDLGAALSGRVASHLFFVSQIGKYIPGGAWNVVAVGEMGKSIGVGRRTSVSAMLVFWLVSVTTGLAVGWSVALSTDAPLSGDGMWVLWILPAVLIMLAPPVLRRTLNLGLSLLKREPLARQPTARGLVVASIWALIGWLLAGAQVWVLASVLSDQGPPEFSAALGGYALAWTAGFLIVIAPAGAGVREVVLAGLFAGSMGTGAVVALVLMSRTLITGADFVLAALVGALRNVMKADSAVVR